MDDVGTKRRAGLRNDQVVNVPDGSYQSSELLEYLIGRALPAASEMLRQKDVISFAISHFLLRRLGKWVVSVLVIQLVLMTTIELHP